VKLGTIVTNSWIASCEEHLTRTLGLDGATYQEAIANAEVIVQEWIETARELGRPIPEPKGRLVYA
jgi:predicted RNase H-like HicB family nuclease